MDISSVSPFTRGVGGDTAVRSIPNPMPAAPASGGGFGASLDEAVNGLEAQAKAADDMAYKYAAGEPVEMHRVIIAAEQARLSITLAAEVRNKVLEAYQELTRSAG